MIDAETYALAKAYTDKHSGGGGTTDYEKLDNLPQVNGHTLIGNKTSAELGLSLVGEYSNENLSLS